MELLLYFYFWAGCSYVLIGGSRVKAWALWVKAWALYWTNAIVKQCNGSGFYMCARLLAVTE